MLEFRPVTMQDIDTIGKYTATCNYGLCEYSVGVNLMWYKAFWAETKGCLVIKFIFGDMTKFLYPIKGENGDVNAALDEIDNYCANEGIAPSICVIPEDKITKILLRYPYVKVSNIRTWQDYVYEIKNLQEYQGRKYAGQRNHVRRFRGSYPDAYFKKLTLDDIHVLEKFWRDYEDEMPETKGKAAHDELLKDMTMFSLLDKTDVFMFGGMFIGTGSGRKLIAVSMAEKCGDTLIMHIEKALYSYQGIYPTFVQEYARAFGEGCIYANREDDAADKGLRTSKLQYGPLKTAAKFMIETENELMQGRFPEIPELSSERLTYSAITEEDLPEYNALVLDSERNRWWGYDDVAGLGAPVEHDSFLRVAQRDFENKLAINFAVRLDGKMIGEAVIYAFDYKGKAELGFRIDKAYAGNGYGREAMRAISDWGLYSLGLRKVFCKCFKENEASYKVLSTEMRSIGEDETFCYFIKMI